MCAVYVVLAVVLLVPSVRSVFAGAVPTAFSGYLLGVSASYLFPVLTRRSALYEAGVSSYTSALVVILMYVFYLSVAYGMTPSFPGRRTRRVREEPVDTPRGGKARTLVFTFSIALTPLLLAFYLHHRVGIQSILQDVYLYGPTVVGQYLAGIQPLGFALYLLNGLFIYRVIHGWKSGWNILLTLLISALWGAVVIFTGQVGLAVLVGGVLVVLGLASQRVVAGALLVVLISAVVVGYVVLLRVDPAIVETAATSVQDIWTLSVDKLWALAWTCEKGGTGLLGSSVMPPAQGWKYGVLVYVPPDVSIERGYDTGRYLAAVAVSSGEMPTGQVSRLRLEDTSVGGPVEALLNLGYFGLLLQGLIWGALLSIADSWVKITADRVLACLLFVLAVSAPSSSLSTHLTLFLLTILGYSLIRERRVAVSASPEEKWFEALSPDADGGSVNELPGAGEVGDGSEAAPERSPSDPEAFDGTRDLPEIERRPVLSSHAGSGTSRTASEVSLALLPARGVDDVISTGAPPGGTSDEGGPVLPGSRVEQVSWGEDTEFTPDEIEQGNGAGQVASLSSLRYGPDEETEEIDLVELLGVLTRRWKLIATIILAAVGASILLSVAMPRRYEVSTTILVRDVPQARGAGVTAQTLAAFAVSDQVLRTVSQDVPLHTLRNSFNVRLDSTARVVTLTASAETAGDAFIRAQKWLEGFTVEVSHLIGVESSEEPLVKVFVAPSFPEKPVSPRIALNIAVSLLLGLFAGSAAAFSLDALEKARKGSAGGGEDRGR